MRKKALRLLIAVSMLAILLALVAVPAGAFDARSGTDVTITAGEVISGDLYVAGSNITIDGTVNGDVFGMGQIITINGAVNGGVSLAAQTIILNGNVATGARVAGQTVRVGGSVGRDLVVAASEAFIGSTAVISGSVNSFSGNTVIDGRVNGDVSGSMDSLTITGGVNGGVDVMVNTLRIASTANVQGDVNYTSRNEANIEPGSTVGGAVNRTPAPEDGREKDRGAGIAGAIIFGIFSFLAIFVIGILLLLLARRYLFRLALTIKDRPLPSLGWGALLLFITPLAALVAMLTIIGIPLGVLMLVVWGILLYLSQIPVALLIGWLILSRRRANLSFGLLVGCLALGLLILRLIGAIPIAGWIFNIAVIIFGLGSLIAAWRNWRHYDIETPTTYRGA